MKKMFLASALLLALSSTTWATGTRSDPAFNGPRKGEPNVPNVGGDGCATPPTVVGALPYTDSGTSCGAANDFNNNGPSTCRTNLNFTYPGPDVIYRVNLGTGNNVGYSMSLTGSTGDLAMFLLTDCGVDTSCVANSQDAIGPGAGPETIAAASRTPGDYYLYIDSYYGSGGASCGTYTLNVTGTLPVELESFSIQ